MSRRQSIGNEDIRYRVLRMLSEEPELSQRQIAERLGISLGAVNYCLRAFISAGLVKLSRFHESSDKRRYAYLLTPSGLGEKAMLTGQFLSRKIREQAELAAEIDAIRQELQSDRQSRPYQSK